MSKKIRVPFSNATEFDIWYDNNCCECRHMRNCAIEHGLGIAMGTQTISRVLFERAGGFFNEFHQLVPCKEKNRQKHPRIGRPHKDQLVIIDWSFTPTSVEVSNG